MKHVMIDLETLGTAADAAFISVGACKFDPNIGEIGDTYYTRLDWEDVIRDRSITGNTLKWWMEQDYEAREEILKPGITLKTTLTELQAFIHPQDVVWGNGSTFDISILQHAYKNDTPWAFWNVRDVRTVVDMASQININRNDFKFEGVAHNALDDAIHQARFVSVMWQALTNKGE